jgi:GT2 family glycosyltransferase
MSPRVRIGIVSYNSARHLEACLESLKAQTYTSCKVLIWDNASTDNTPAIIEQYRDFFHFIHLSDRNLGFSAAHNHLISSSDSEYSLVLNPDVVLETRYLEVLVGEMERDPSAGSAMGKLLRLKNGGTRILDSAGIYMTPNQRHLDRGSGEIDTGQYQGPEYVFGATGAAALYRRTMLEQLRHGSEYFDESFFAYREDADLAWRAQWMGWRCLYVPGAIGYHERRVVPERRSALPDVINMHSFKNRFLLRVKNMDIGTYARFFVPITLRDAAAVIYVLALEWSSLPGILHLARALPRTWRWRRSIMARRKISPREMRAWFSYKPVSKPKHNR